MYARKVARWATVIQSYLYRSAGDMADLLHYGCRIRLCKGAYKESAEVAFPKKRDVDANYIHLMQHAFAERCVSRHRHP